MDPIVSDLPEPLAIRAAQAWQLILDAPMADSVAAVRAQLDEPLARQLARVLACSPFVVETLRRKPEMLLDLIVSGDLQNSLAENAFMEALQRLLEGEEVDLHRELRQFRARHMLRIVWRDFCRLADTLETVRDTSLLAEACIKSALEYCQAKLEQRFGRPLGHSGQHQQMLVLAMGKLGARELNVSSDIDLIFTYPEGGKTDHDEKSISNEQFFTKLGQALISALDQNTVDGFVFRVDMRLRPYGDSGSLALNFAALEEYYQDQGRDWERYALIKARPVTGHVDQADELMAALRPFVFRRYIDFGVIDSLRSMKQMINAEVRRRGLQSDVKLGHGGIREVEFIAQCFQLIRGGRDLGLQQRELLSVLHECAEIGCLPPEVSEELRSAYLFLRDSEHAIQGYEDRQTQALPEDEAHRLAMAFVMGFPDWDEYLAALAAHRDIVSGHFRDLIAAPDEGGEESAEAAVPWGEALGAQHLAELGFQAPDAALAQLQALQSSPRVLTLQSEGKKRLEEFMPQLIAACAQAKNPDLSLTRVLPLVAAVLRRSAYLVLLLENPQALDELILLCGASPWIAEQLTQHPVLLDELLDRASLYTAPDKNALRDELRQQVARLSETDLEQQMDALRYFKASHVLRVAASEVVGRLPLMKVSDKLTWIAEVILEQVLAVAWADLVAKYGEPEREGAGYGFAVFGYGKLGGIELGYSSDLDLVFLYDGAARGVSNGPKSIDNTVFYTRLGQRMIHILDTRMALGQLYEVDMRLRPSGDSGMLVTSAAGFASYQLESAWTWEHQALVRARFVAGDPALATQVETVRRQVLGLERDPAALAGEVQAMREKMREHLLPASGLENGEFHLKQGAGGIVDIEFMVQYAVLAWSHDVPGLTQWSDNVRILETLGREDLFEQQVCDTLTDAYLAFRSAAHQLSLQQQPGIVAADRFVEYTEAVQGTWQQLFAPFNTGNTTK
jgi:[glutamine synthetase] adenylyltransferase / [glutamine synthetase]-adenylyl-L-tyrosine phosphorylase